MIGDSPTGGVVASKEETKKTALSAVAAALLRCARDFAEAVNGGFSSDVRVGVRAARRML